MQKEFARHYPSLQIKILGINEVGQESANNSITNGRDIPWLQDVDQSPQNGKSDVWYDSWKIEYRDVVVVDTAGNEVGRFNVTPHSLAIEQNYNDLKTMFVNSAKKPPVTLWQSPVEPLDVTNDGRVELSDALQVINTVQLRTYPNGTLPKLLNGATPPAYYDVTGSGQVAAQDAVVIINHLAIVVNPQAALSSGVVAEDSAGNAVGETVGALQDLAKGIVQQPLSQTEGVDVRSDELETAVTNDVAVSTTGLTSRITERSSSPRASTLRSMELVNQSEEATAYEKSIDELFAIGW